jgi:hypothetical protein
MMSIILLSVSVLAQSVSSEVDAAQFARLTQGLLSRFQDVTLVYEGGLLRTDNEDERMTYQGLYSFRSDGATLLDLYSRPADLSKMHNRRINAILNKKLNALYQVPDRGYTQPDTSGGGAGVLNFPTSPERILYLWYLQTLGDPDAYGYEFQGWEYVDGHRCLRAQLSVIAKRKWGTWRGDKPYIRLWIDVERGGHPLKVEFLRGSNLYMRSDKIQLGREALPDGTMAWFPLSGETNSFTTPSKTGGDEYHSSPVYRETYAVVDGSVRLNQGLPDTYFTVDRKNATFADREMTRLKQELDATPQPPPMRTDPASVKQRIGKLLAEADRQSRRLEASSAARQAWGMATFIQYLSGSIGFLLLLGAAIWRWRSR